MNGIDCMHGWAEEKARQQPGIIKGSRAKWCIRSAAASSLPNTMGCIADVQQVMHPVVRAGACCSATHGSVTQGLLSEFLQPATMTWTCKAATDRHAGGLSCVQAHAAAWHV